MELTSAPHLKWSGSSLQPAQLWLAFCRNLDELESPHLLHKCMLYAVAGIIIPHWAVQYSAHPFQLIGASLPLALAGSRVFLFLLKQILCFSCSSISSSSSCKRGTFHSELHCNQSPLHISITKSKFQKIHCYKKNSDILGECQSGSSRGYVLVGFIIDSLWLNWLFVLAAWSCAQEQQH